MEKLKIGDVVFLKEKQIVYGDIPELYIYSNSLSTKIKKDGEITIGKEYYFNKTAKAKFVDECISKLNKIFNDLSLSNSFIKSTNGKIIEEFENYTCKNNNEIFIVPEGEFIITQVIPDWDETRERYRYYCKYLFNGIFIPESDEYYFFTERHPNETGPLKVIRSMTPTFI